jgi:hypothetical protein
MSNCKENCDCKTVTEKKVKSITTNIRENDIVKGTWLNTGNNEESVHAYSWHNGVVLAYNCPNHNRLQASRMALSIKEGKCEFQFFTGDKVGDIKIVNVNADLVYNKIYGLLKDLEQKALDTIKDEIK